MNADKRGSIEGGMRTPLSIRWFLRSWVQIKGAGNVIYVDPAYIREYFIGYDPIDGQVARLEKADLILVTHPHKSHCKRETIDALRGHLKISCLVE